MSNIFGKVWFSLENFIIIGFSSFFLIFSNFWWVPNFARFAWKCFNKKLERFFGFKCCEIFKVEHSFQPNGLLVWTSPTTGYLPGLHQRRVTCLDFTNHGLLAWPSPTTGYLPGLHQPQVTCLVFTNDGLPAWTSPTTGYLRPSPTTGYLPGLHQ